MEFWKTRRIFARYMKILSLNGNIGRKKKRQWKEYKMYSYQFLLFFRKLYISVSINVIKWTCYMFIRIDIVVDFVTHAGSSFSLLRESFWISFRCRHAFGGVGRQNSNEQKISSCNFISEKQIMYDNNFNDRISIILI